jgi:hypothetical protein
VLKLGSIEITNYDIGSFSQGRDLTVNIVDAYYSILRGRLRKTALKHRDSERVLLLNYKLTNAIFDSQSSEAVCSRCNVFQYE